MTSRDQNDCAWDVKVSIRPVWKVPPATADIQILRQGVEARFQRRADEIAVRIRKELEAEQFLARLEPPQEEPRT